MTERTRLIHDELIVGRLVQQMNDAAERGNQVRAADIAARVQTIQAFSHQMFLSGNPNAAVYITAVIEATREIREDLQIYDGVVHRVKQENALLRRENEQLRATLASKNTSLQRLLHALQKRMNADAQTKGQPSVFPVFQTSDDALEDMIRRAAGLSFQENSV